MDCHHSSSVIVVAVLLFGTLINASPAYVAGSGRRPSFPLTPATIVLPVQSTSAAAAADAAITTTTAPIWGASRTEVLRDGAAEPEESSSSESTDAFEADLETPTISVASAEVQTPQNVDVELLTACQRKCILDYFLPKQYYPGLNDKTPLASKSDCMHSTECKECLILCADVQPPPHQPLRPLRIVAMVKQEFLVSTRVAWPQVPALDSCYVTWEVHGGGLVGHLLTDAGAAELSLWPDTKYRVVVVCKNRITGKLIRSPTLFINTANAMSMKPDPPSSSEESDSLLINFGLENRILKGSDSSSSSDKSRRTDAAQTQLTDNIIGTGPQIEHIAHRHPDPHVVIAFVLLLVALFLMADFLAFGPCRYACRTLHNVVRFGPDAYSYSTEQLVKMQDGQRESAPASCPAVVLMPAASEAASSSLSPVTHLQYVRYVEGEATTAAAAAATVASAGAR